MNVDIYSDCVCPWCFIGKRRFEEARRQRPGLQLDVHWRAFELNPGIAPGGRDRQEYLLAKFGGGERLKRLQEQLHDVGVSVGIGFRFDLIQRMPNTRAAHALLAVAAEDGRQDAVSEALFNAYFETGRDIGDRDILLALGAAQGLDRAQLSTAFDEPAVLERILAEETQAHDWGISGVPTFIFDGRYALSGAQPVEVFLQLFDRLSGSVSAA
ncbi:MAG TPA: DsbA family oxidoreductase [Steroidobacteraceae bacterium]|jgi:predicted DsbA family dithiol-disulfide isomerase|nr:DsbA family oxidoreductase [Steroidobacteraceae bacterium]